MQPTIAIRKWTATALLATLFCAIAGLWWTVAHSPKFALPWGEHLLFGLFAAGAGLATWGVARQRPWGRWFGLSAGLSGVVLLGSIIAMHGMIELVATRALLLGLGFPLLVLCLVGPRMAERYELQDGGRGIWTVRDPRAAMLNWLPILALTSMPLLATHAITGVFGVASFLRESRYFALGAALLVAVGVTLLLYRRTVGALALIGAAGLATASLIAVYSSAMADGRAYAAYAVNLAPLIVAGGVGTLLLARPMIRLLRQR